MYVYALMGHIEYEGTDLLGIYPDRESAIAALDAFRGSSADVFTYYLDRLELGSAARSVLSEFSDHHREWLD